MSIPRAAAVVLAGGSGTRLGADLNKVYLPLCGRPVLSWSFSWAAQVPEIGHFVLVVRPQDGDLATAAMRSAALPPGGPRVDVVVGGDSRHQSEQAGLQVLRPQIESGQIEVVAIHDGARPLAGPALWRSVVLTAAAVGGAVPALTAAGVVPVRADPAADAAAWSTPDRWSAPGSAGRLVRVQTPQAFRAAGLLTAYREAAAAGFQGSDTACSVETFSDLTVRAVPGSRQNVKVTYLHDLVLAERLLSAAGHRLS